MSRRFRVMTQPRCGKRVNATPESDCSPAETEMQQQSKSKKDLLKSRVLSILGTALLWAPILTLIVFAIHGAAAGQPLPLLIYAFVLFAFRTVDHIGSLFLYLGARKAKHLQRPIGWTALAILIFSIFVIVFTGQYIPVAEPAKISPVVVYLSYGSFALTLVGMAALNVLSVLLLIHLFRRSDSIVSFQRGV